jgi:hypothetical protein
MSRTNQRSRSASPDLWLIENEQLFLNGNSLWQNVFVSLYISHIIIDHGRGLYSYWWDYFYYSFIKNSIIFLYVVDFYQRSELHPRRTNSIQSFCLECQGKFSLDICKSIINICQTNYLFLSDTTIWIRSRHL